MKLVKAINYDVNNGDGFRLSIWVSGCPIKCKGCHNKDLWDESLGVDYTPELEDTIVELLKDKHLQGLSILGGEPLAPYNVQGVKKLCERVKKEVPDKTIWLWTGYTVDKVFDLGLSQLLDVVIDGQFIQELKEPDLQWRGSNNQGITYLL